jgi:hypothetical protein
MFGNNASLECNVLNLFSIVCVTAVGGVTVEIEIQEKCSSVR